MSDPYDITFALADPTPGRRKNRWDATIAPGASDDSAAGYKVGSVWVDVSADTSYRCVDATAAAAVWIEEGGTGGGGAPATADYLVGTAQGGLSAEIVVGTTPGGELGGSWATPTVDATHSGSSHADIQAAAEATAAAALAAHLSDASDAHAASAISLLDTADDFTATDVEGALAELQADAEAHAAAGDPHTGYATDTDLSTHAGAVDPHTGYQKESEKSAASGYASLDGSVKVPIAELPTGTTGTTVALGNHGHSDAAPPGLISPFGSSTPPTGWLLCDGTSYATATYAALFAVIGYTFGGAGANFNVPDLKGRVVVGYDAAEASFDAVGETGGAKTHTHAGHSDHAALTNNHTGTAVANPAGEAAHTHSGSGSTGAGTSHSHPGSGVTGWHGGHQHYNNGIGTGGPSSVSVADFGAQWNPANSDHTHQVWGWTDSGGGHDHGASSTGGEASHTHPASAVGAGSSHTHTQGAVTQPTAHGAISAHSAHDTPSHLPPYLAIPYIIKT